MTEPRKMRWITQETAEEEGLDQFHLMDHLVDTALCLLNGRLELLDVGLFVKIKDTSNREWTFSVIPEDGGAITDALLQQAGEES